jgi:hypothetical protein
MTSISPWDVFELSDRYLDVGRSEVNGS